MRPTRRRVPPPNSPPQRRQCIWSHVLLFAFIICFCVTSTLQYVGYGGSSPLLGPASSRLIEVSSVFVKQLFVSNKNNHNQLILHLFNHMPRLSSQTSNWTSSNFFLVTPYDRKGISLWLNKGSTIRVRWEARASSLNQLQGVVIKGENEFQELQPKETSFLDALDVHDEIVDGKEAEYIVEEDEGYHIGVLNMNAMNIALTMRVNVSAKVYDTTKAEKMCSIANGSCRLDFLFPHTYYVIFTAPNYGDIITAGGVEISFTIRVVTYVFLLGFCISVFYLILKSLGVDFYDRNTNGIDHTHRTSTNVVATQTETEPLMRLETNRVSYGTNKQEDEESEGNSSSSEDLYNEKLCVICYDEQRNSFFVPCGHSATCCDCAKRIMDREGNMCPICRRLIRKVRMLYHN